MSRTTPDPVFAAAARLELERRVRAARPDAGAVGVMLPFRPRRAWRMELAAIAGVVALVAGVAAGVQALRPALTDDRVPAIADTRTADPRPSLLPTSTPTASPTTDAPVPTAPAVTPTTPPATLPPTSAPPTTPPPTAPTRTATTPPPATSSALIGPSGAQRRSEAELRAWGSTIGASSAWIGEVVLDTRCMAEHGFLYDAEFEYTHGVVGVRNGMSADQYARYDEAEHGPQTDAPYDWRSAGCHGLSVHAMQKDDAN
jgi:hypothetical protein